MRREKTLRSRSRFGAALFCALVLLPIPLDLEAQSVAAPIGTGARVIVKFKAGSQLLGQAALAARRESAARASALGQRLRLALAAGAAVSERAQVLVATGLTSAELARRLAAEADVEYAVPDERRRIVAAPNDPLYADGVPGNGPAAGQWYLRPPTTSIASSINVEPAWDVTLGIPGVVVAVVDTGVRFDHPDLLRVTDGGNLLPGYDMVSDPVVANDGDGRDADPSDPGDWVTQAELSQVGGPFYQCTDSPEDSSWHGTQVSGLIAALTNNGIGMASVGRNVRVLPVRALGKCFGYDSDIIAGMRWAAGLAVPGAPANPYPARVINLSLGGDGVCTAAYQEAVNEILSAGTAIVAAAGNGAGHAVTVPADCPGVIAVAGLRHAGTKVGFSNLGPEIAISAPGGNCVNTAAGSPCLYPILTTSDSGTTVPAGPIYTDSFNASLGTSFSAPLVAGTLALMMSAQPGLTPQQARQMLQATARPFPTGVAVATCTAPQYDASGNPIDQLECGCTTTTCGAGIVDAGAAVRTAAGLTAPALNVQGLWWAAGGTESGWGINFAHQGDQVFATWYTYDPTGRAWWLSMLANRSLPAGNTYSGPIYVDSGPPFYNFIGSATAALIGNGTLSFTDANNGSFAYTVNGTTQNKAIGRFDMGTGPQPTCAYSARTPNFVSATNYQDLWWAASGAEPGWGINLAHQGNSVFATWYTYDVDGAPVWLSVLATRVGASNVYAGTLYRTSGPRFDAFDPAKVVPVQVGTATLTFTDGNHATFAYATNGAGGLPRVSQSKSVVRFPFAAAGGTLCQ